MKTAPVILSDPRFAVSGDLVIDPSDGRPARAVHTWSRDKHHYLKSYMDIFATGMKNRWHNRVYLDLFAGPGRCYDLETREFYDGSPLLAFNWPFTHHLYVELNEVAAEALEARSDERRTGQTVRVLQGDCNHRIDDIIGLVPTGRTLVFAFLDPTSTQLHYESVRRLTDGHSVDILLTLMTSQLKRVLTPNREMDAMFGTAAWREKPYLGADGKPSSDGLLACYADQLSKLGYILPPGNSRPVTIYGAKNAPLYVLAFFSKNKLGYDFWERVTRSSRGGQIVLPL